MQTEQPLQGMGLREKEGQKDLGNFFRKNLQLKDVKPFRS